MTEHDRPPATNTGGWMDAEDEPLGTCASIANLLAMILELHPLDEGQRLLLQQAIEPLETLGAEAPDELRGVEEDEDG